MRKRALLTSATLFVLVGVVPVDAEVIFRGRDAVGLYYAHPCTGETLYFAGWWHGTATLVFAKDGSGRYQYHQNEHTEVFDVEGGQKVGMYNKTIREDLKGFYPDGDYSYLTTFNQRMSLQGASRDHRAHPDPAHLHCRRVGHGIGDREAGVPSGLRAARRARRARASPGRSRRGHLPPHPNRYHLSPVTR